MHWSERVKSVLEARQMTNTALADAIGVPGKRLDAWLQGRVDQPRGFSVILPRIAEVLGVSLEWLRDGTGSRNMTVTLPAPSGQPDLKVEAQTIDAPVPNAADMPKDLPVRGTAAGADGGVGAMQFDGGVVDYVRRPPGIAGAKEVYGLYVVGDSMWPRFPNGELVICHPRRPVNPGNDVVIQVQRSEHDEIEVFVKTMLRRTGSEIIAQQYNPDKTMTFKTSEVIAIHRILTLPELLGF